MSHGHGAERRKFGRKETNVAALAEAPGRGAVACTIRNISQMGALVEFDQPFSCRGGFRLYVAGDMLDAHCQVRRREGNALGVEFVAITAHKLAPQPSECTCQAPLYEAARKPELVASSGRDLRAKLFGKSAPESALP